MENPGQLDTLRKAAQGTLSDGSLWLDEEDGVLCLGNSLIFTVSWALISIPIGIGLLLVGVVLVPTIGMDWALWALIPGAALAGLPLLYALILKVTSLERLAPELELRFAERTIVYRGAEIPFDELRPEHLVWHKGRLYHLLRLRHPTVRKRVALFYAREEEQAEEFRRRLLEMVADPDLPDLLAYGSDLTPVQRWMVGAGAMLAGLNEFPLDRLGLSPEEEWAEIDRGRAEGILRDWWNVHELEDLLSRLHWLVGQGHRADFAHDAALAARPDVERAEYARLLSEVDDLIAQQRTEPPFLDRLIELVTVRYGQVASAYVETTMALLEDRPGADASPEGAELSLFLEQLFNDRDHASEELHRLKALEDPTLLANVGRFMIWDYGRAMTLYRCGYMVDWLTEEYCWNRMLPLARDIQRNYTSWRDMATCYLQGRLLWSGGGGEQQIEYEGLVERLATAPDSPWNLVPWDLELERDWD